MNLSPSLCLIPLGCLVFPIGTVSASPKSVTLFPPQKEAVPVSVFVRELGVPACHSVPIQHSLCFVWCSCRDGKRKHYLCAHQQLHI